MAPNHFFENEVLYESDHEWHLIMIDSPIYGRFFISYDLNHHTPEWNVIGFVPFILGYDDLVFRHQLEVCGIVYRRILPHFRSKAW